MRNILVIGLSLLLPFLLMSQSSKEYPGHIINLQGVVVEGLIKDLDWNQSPDKIAFKAAKANDFTEYSPKDILGFYGSGSNSTYVSKVVKINISSHKTDKLSIEAQPEMVEKHLFLERLYNGDLYKLLKHVDLENLSHYFIQDDQEEIVELIKHKYSAKGNSVNSTSGSMTNKVIKVVEKYRGQLNYYFKDCPSVSKEIDKLRFGTQPLIELFNDYHVCKGKETEDFKKIKTMPIRLSIHGGAAFSKYKVKDDSDFLYSEAWHANPFNASVGPTFGIAIEITTKGKYELLSFYLGTNFYAQNINQSINFDRAGSIVGTTNHQITTELSTRYLDINMGLGFTFLHTKTVRPFLKLGVASHTIISKSPSLVDIRTSSFSPNDPMTIMPTFINDGSYEKWAIVPVFELGINIKDFFISSTFLFNYVGYSRAVAINDSQINVLVQAGYRLLLNKKKVEANNQ